MDINFCFFLSQNNQTYYNKQSPLSLTPDTINDTSTTLLNKNQLQKLYSSDKIPTNYNELDLHKESFSEHNSDNLHEVHTTHILECQECKQVLLKQFNIETERIRNEEILELIIFLIFGLFILLLLDTK